MNKSLSQQQSIVLGLFVADAASMGLHWIYDYDHLQKIAVKDPVFHPPLFENYDGVFGFLAHEKRTLGDFSHYGETALLVLQNLAFNNKKFDLLNYQKIYRDYFGAGGSYVGYIDNPTRITLENLIAADYKSAEIGKQASTDFDDETAKVILQKVLPYTRLYQGDDLIAPVISAITVTYDDPKILDYALKMAETIDKNRLLKSGADDQQLPALASAALFACCYQGADFEVSLEATVRITNNNQNGVDAALFIAKLAQAILSGATIENAINGSQDNQSRFITECLTKYNSVKELTDLKQVSEQCGRTCYLKESIPLSLWLLTHSTDYEEAINLNILAGGDSCGRSYIVGALAGGIYWENPSKSMPSDWLTKLNKVDELSQLI